ncbi:ATP-dependent DNA helicase PIF1-like protein [Tanacetum coccineum]
METNGMTHCCNDASVYQMTQTYSIFRSLAPKFCKDSFRYNYQTGSKSAELMWDKININNSGMLRIVPLQPPNGNRIDIDQIAGPSTSNYASTRLRRRSAGPLHLRLAKKATKKAAFISVGVSVTYHNIGPPSHECRNCHANMLYKERKEKSKTAVNPTFSLCCQGGKVLLPTFNDTPPPLNSLLDYNHLAISKFQDQIRVYNSMFCFTSFGAKIDHSINTGRALYTFRISGQIYHQMGSLIPNEGTQPKFAQLYFFYTQNEVRNRQTAFINKDTSDGVDQQIVRGLIQMLDHYSSIVKAFRMARDWCNTHNLVNFHLVLHSDRKSTRQYNVLTVYKVVVVILNDFEEGLPTRDVIMHIKDIGLGKRIVLPRTFTGSPRYMMQNYKDAMAICRAYGNPDLFITFTSNQKWPELAEILNYFPGQKAHDRPEVGTSVFKIKLTELLNELIKKHVFGESHTESLHALLQREGIDVTMFTDWFEMNKRDPAARILTYAEIPKYYVWHEQTKLWKLRKQIKCIGRITYSSPASSKRYYLRMLLNVVRGVQGFEELMTVNNRICPTFKESYFAYSLLNDDKEWTKAISEASLWALGPQLRDIFVTMLLFCDIRNYCLLEIQDLLHRYGRSLEDFKDLPWSDPSLLTNMDNRLIREALDFDIKKQVKIRTYDCARGRLFRNCFLAPPGRKKKPTFWWHDRSAKRRLQAKPLVIPKAKRPKIVQACINRSGLWKYCKVFTLTRSMRVNEYFTNGALDASKQEFNRWVLAMGDENLLAKIKEGEDEPTWIEIPERFLIKQWDTSIEQIVAETYPDFTSRQIDEEYLKERAILTPINEDADAINEFMFKKLSGEVVTYNSVDEICKASTDNIDQHQLYPVEFLNSLNFLGMPPHELCLKKNYQSCSYRMST